MAKEEFQHLENSYTQYTTDRNSSLVRALSQPGLNADDLNNKAKDALPLAYDRFIFTSTFMGYSEVVANIINGPKGAGKTTQEEILAEAVAMFEKTFSEGFRIKIPEGVQRILDRYSDQTKVLVTGTGGMVSDPVGEYEEYEDFAEKLRSIRDAGDYVGDELMTVALLSKMVGHMAEGYSKFSIKTHPRTDRQLGFWAELADQARNPLSYETSEGRGVKTEIKLNLTYMTFMDDEAIERLNANRQGYATEAKRVSREISKWVKEHKNDFDNWDDNKKSTEVEGFLAELVLGGNEMTPDFVNEINYCKERSEKRKAEAIIKGEEPRKDENATSTLARVGNDLAGAVAFYKESTVKIVSAAGDADQVVERMIMSEMNEGDKDNLALQALVRLAKEVAIKKVPPARKIIASETTRSPSR